MRSSKLFAWMLIASTAGIAAAQPNPTPMQPSGGPDAPDTTTPPAPAPPPPAPTPPPPAPRVEPPPADRPDELAFAIGLGYIFPTSLETPNITSVRLRLPSGLTFEPRLIFANTSHETDDGITTTIDTSSEISLGALVRIPALRRGRVDFEVLAAADIDYLKDNPDGDNNNTTTTTISVSWGVAVSYWLGRHWSFSLSATNPLATYTKKKAEIAADMSSTTTDKAYGVIFDPVVFAMIHLYN